MWIVIKFIESDEVEAIPSNWYNEEKKVCFYPRLPKSGMEKAIKQRLEPKPDWLSYKVQLLSKQHYLTFSMASAKASKACVMSDISDQEMPSKRVSKRVTRSEYDTDNSDTSLSSFPESSTISRQIAKSTRQGGGNCDEEFEKDNPEPEEGNVNAESIVKDVNLDSEEFKENVIHNLLKNKKILKDVEKTVENLQKSMDGLKILLEKLLDDRTDQGKSNEDSTYDIFEKFPVTTVEQLDEVETILQDKMVFSRLVKDLARLGGVTYKECIRRYLTKIVNNEVAQHFNMYGHKGNKKSFATYKVCRVVIDAVKAGNLMVTEKDIQTNISIWLTKANERLNKEKQTN